MSLDRFCARAQSDDPVFLHEVRAAFSRDAAHVLLVQARCADGRARRWALPFCEFDAENARQLAFVRRYLHANLANLLAALGPCEVFLCVPDKCAALLSLLGELDERFCVSLPPEKRAGLGKSLNVAERIAASKGETAPFRFTICERLPALWAEKAVSRAPLLWDDLWATTSRIRALGIDVGGTDVKLCASTDGKLSCCKEFDWNPAAFQTAEALLAPLLLLTRVMRAALACPAFLAGLRAEALAAAADEKTMRRFCEAVEKHGPIPGFDAIGVSFPDVIVQNRIVGGETSKTKGMRENPALDYETQLAALRDLNERLAAFGTKGCRVSVINDGSMAAFAQLVEEGCHAENGVFAHTLGTDIGSGWALSDGSVPDLPLEVYSFVVDLGSDKKRGYPPADARTICSENTGVAGTLHCTVNQSGAFRMAAERFPSEAPELWRIVLQSGFLTEDGPLLRIVPEKRKDFLAFLMQKAEEGEPVCRGIFREIGRFLGAAWQETQFWLSPASKTRPLFGRMLRSGACFSLLCEGAAETAPDARFTAADETLAATPLMRQLSETPYPVAQFAQAVGAIYWGANALL